MALLRLRALVASLLRLIWPPVIASTCFRAGSCSAPLQRHGDVARHAAGKIDDLDPQLVSTLAEVFRPELIDLLRHASQRVFPARLLLVDGAPLVRAQLVREAVHLHLGPAVADGALDDLDRALNCFLVREARWFRQLGEQRLLLVLRLSEPARLLGCFFGLG